MCVGGVEIKLKSDESRFYWTPAPPKLDVVPSRVREILFPQYTQAATDQQTQISRISPMDVIESDEELEEEMYVKEDTDHDRETTVEWLVLVSG